MDAELFVSKSTRGMILDVLSRQQPLKAQQLRSSIQQQFGQKVGRSTLHGHLRDLQDKSVLLKDNEGYKYHPKWIEEVKEFSSRLDSKGSPLGEVLAFDSLEEMDNYYHNFKRKFIDNINPEKDNTIAWIAPHVRSIFFSLGKYSKMTMEARKKNIQYFVVIGGNTTMDKLAEPFYKKFNVNVKVGTNILFNCRVAIFNETLLMFQYHPETYNAIEEMYKNAKSIEDVNSMNYMKIYNKNLKHYLFIIKDKNLVKFYKKHILSFFET